MDLHYRPLDPGDAASVHALALDPSLAQSADYVPGHSHDTLRAALAHAGARWLGAFESDGTLVGCASLHIPTNRRRTHTAHVRVGVAATHRRRGMGMQLLRRSVDAADRWFNIVRLETTLPAASGAGATLLERVGFVRETHERAALWTDGAYVDRITLGRLRPGFRSDVAGAMPASAVQARAQPAMPAQLRAVRVGDAAALAGLHDTASVIHGTLQLPWPSVAMWQARIAAQQADGDVVLVAEVDGNVAGFAMLQGNRSPRRRHAWTLAMSVGDAYQGARIGTQLLGALVQTADAWLAATRLELVVYKDNPRAIALYERHGFVSEGVILAESWRNGTYADCLAMARVRLSR